MIKVKKTIRKVSPFGGLNFVIDELENAGIPELINSSLPKRHGRAKYSHADGLLSLIYGVFCGADRLEDFGKLKGRMHNSSLNIPSPDALGKFFKKDWKMSPTAQGNHEIYTDTPLTSLLLDIAFKLKQLNTDKGYTLDFDNTCLPCEKWDSEFCYKGFQGYQPGAFFIGMNPVYIEGMNGSNPAAGGQGDTMRRCLELLEQKDIQVKRFRADAASYQKTVLKQMEDKGIEFFVRASSSNPLYDEICCVEQWETVTLGVDTFEVAEFLFNPFGLDGMQRAVVSRRPHKEGKLHDKTEEPFVYRAILTNNMDMKPDHVTWFYNQRGAIEKNFDILNNDWNWSKLPFSFLSENTPFMIITAMGLVMYNYLLNLFASKVNFVEDTYRLKTFRYNFIAVSAEWKQDTLLIHDTTRQWEKLAG